MLFGFKRERVIRKVLIVEDEPLVAFDNEHFLRDAGYQVVATVDTADAAVDHVADEGIDLVLADVKLSDGNGLDVAQAARRAGVPLVFVTGGSPEGAAELAMGVLAKPYTQRDLLGTIEAVEARLSGRKPKRMPRGLTMF